MKPDDCGNKKEGASFQEACPKCSLKIGETEILDSEQAAFYLGISKATLGNLTSAGKLPFYKFGRRNRYLKSELTQLLLSERRGAYGI